MNPSPDVTVIIPVYNTADAIADCLDSVLTQAGVSLEVVAVDDGSTDGSGAILDEWAASHDALTVIHQQNSGWAGAPRNRGLERARGRYVFFVDADDLLTPDALADMVAFADLHEVDVLVPRIASPDDRNVHSAVFEETLVEAPVGLLTKTNYPFKLVRATLVEEHGLRFPEAKVRLEDAQFVFAAYAASSRNAILADRDYYVLRTRPGGGNISRTKIDPWNHIVGVRRSIEALDGGAWDAEERREAQADFFRRVVLIRYDGTFRGRSRAQQAAWARANFTLVDLVDTQTAVRYFRPRNRARLQGLRRGNIQAMLAVARYSKGRLGFAECLDVIWAGTSVGISGSYTPVFNNTVERIELQVRPAGAKTGVAVPTTWALGEEVELLGTREASFTARVPLHRLLRIRNMDVDVVSYDESNKPTRARLFSPAAKTLTSTSIPLLKVSLAPTAVGGARLQSTLPPGRTRTILSRAKNAIAPAYRAAARLRGRR